MTITSNQSHKAANAMAETLSGVTADQKKRFAGELQRALLKQGKWNLFGVYNQPNSFLRGVLTRTKLPISALTDVIVVSFAAADKIRVYHNGNWREI